MRILFTGDYLPDYNRISIIKKGLSQLGVTFDEIPFKRANRDIKQKLKNAAANADVIFLPSFTHKEVKTVRKLFPNKALVFDPLISRYLTKVFDYKLVSPWSISAIRNFYRDKNPMNIADVVLTDTEAHKKYFHQKFKIPLEKMDVLHIGNDFEDFKPSSSAKASHAKLKIGFYGGFIPLQGVMQILAAIKELGPQNYEFELIGNGFEYEKAKDYIRKESLNFISLPGWLSQNDLAERLLSFDIALGIFGSGLKTDLVIPNKVYHYAASKLPIITKDSPAIREIFSNNQNALLVDGSPTSIAKAINDLAANATLRHTIAENAYQTIYQHYSQDQVARRFLASCEKAIRLKTSKT